MINSKQVLTFDIKQYKCNAIFVFVLRIFLHIAILNSLQMGFRTLAIQKRTSEVWSVLGAVKTEFGKFGGMLEKVQKNLQNAGDQLEEVMGKRTRAIERKLRQVEALPTEESHKMLALNDFIDEED